MCYNLVLLVHTQAGTQAHALVLNKTHTLATHTREQGGEGVGGGGLEQVGWWEAGVCAQVSQDQNMSAMLVSVL